MINRPTRKVENSRTLIDVIFSSDTSKIVKCGVSHIGISDHSLVYVIWGKSRGTQPHHVYKTYRNFKNFSESEFQECVSNIDWSLVCNNFDVNESANQFLNLLLKCCNKFAPIRKKKVKKDSLPWINSDILKLMRERDAMKRKAIEINTEDEWKSYRKIRNYVIAKLKYMKKEYFQSRIEFSRGKVKQTWNHLNRLMSRNKKSSEISNVICGDIDIFDPKHIAEKLNEHFVSVGPSLAKKISPDMSDNVFDTNNFIPISNVSFHFTLVDTDVICNL